MNNKYSYIFKDYEINKVHFCSYDYECIVFSRKEAIDLICNLIVNAKKSICIYHRIVDTFNNYYKENRVIASINKNKDAKIKYYSNFDDDSINKMKDVFTNDNISFICINSDTNNYHHKELIIDEEVYIFGSFNFLTNSLVDIDNKNFYLENVSFWFKKKEE